MFYFDSTYLIFIVPALIVSLLAQLLVTSRYNKYSKVLAAQGVTGAEAARRVLLANGITYLRIERISGDLTDHYDPKEDVIRLSQKVYDSASIAAVGVACHEAGHAVQHYEGYLPAKFRNAIVKATNISSRLGVILIIAGIFMATLNPELVIVAYIGIAAYSACALFQLVTLPTEFDASRRGMKAIKDTGILTAEEQKGARKVLSAAALTYVAALFTSVMTILRYLALISRFAGRRND
ncbi:MAG: zinc metallopeptidase [Clostridia bacterium]|jgi:Zn-dependent membrane protease YugP|nr:zinc metallopeptidase [Clostridia bacterium]